MTAPLEYIRAVADQASEQSVPGSVTVELARLTREVVEELTLARPVVRGARLVASPTPWLRATLAAYEARYGEVPADA